MVGVGGEAAGEAEAGAEIHIWMEKKKMGLAVEQVIPGVPLLLLVAEALDVAEAHDHLPQQGHPHHQLVAAERRQHVDPRSLFAILAIATVDLSLRESAG